MHAGRVRSGAAFAAAAGAIVLSLSCGSAYGRSDPARPSTTAAGAVQPNISEAAAEQLGAQAYNYGIPLMEFLRQARQQTSVTVPNAQSDAPLNQLGSARQLDTPRNQVIVQPNHDTLYTMGHLDLSAGALVLHVAAVPDHRYYSFQFLDPYTNVLRYVGTRTTGDSAGTFLITGPQFRGRVPSGLRRIRCAYQRVWLVGRTLVYGPRDLAAAHRIQNGYRLIPLSQYLSHGLGWHPPRPSRVVTRHRSLREPRGVTFFDQLGTALAENPPPRRDDPILRRLRVVGIGPGLYPSQEHLSPPILAGLIAAAGGGRRQVFKLRTAVAQRSVISHHGWFVPPLINGAYGTNYTYRAVVALFGLAANRPQEALYIIGVSDPGYRFLDGAHDYVIHFPPGHLPPARYFWSLTMYNQKFFLVPNSIHRYELASHTPGLRRNPDGSLDVYVQHAPPSGHVSNWLPAPTGQFQVTMRLYGPQPAALQGRYVYPPITPTS